jgi:hypothetical protein
MLIIFFHIKGIVQKDSSWQAEQSIPHTTLATRELAVASRQHTNSHCLFHQGIFYQKQHDSNLPPTLLFFFPDWR